MNKKKSKKKNKNQKRTKQNIITISLVLVFVLTILTIIVFSLPNKEVQHKEETKYFAGSLYSINAAANMLDNLYEEENLVISPINANSALALLYNGTDNNTKNELKKYFNNEPNKNNELILESLNKMNTTNHQKNEKYEKSIAKVLEHKYPNLRVKDIDKLSQKDREEALLIIKKADMYYNQKNNKMKDKEIENYQLTDKEKKSNGYVIKEILDKVMVNYEKYQIENKIINYNEIYYDSNNKTTINKNFLNIANKYNFKITAIDFNNKESDAVVNNNLHTSTKNTLNRAISNNTAEKGIISVNSLYFNYEWKNIFNSENVIDEEFIDNKDTHYMVDMMYGEENTYLENDQAIGFIKSFEDDKYSFVAIIPKNKKEFKASELNIEELLKERKETKTYIGIPKFSFHSQNDLNKLYQNYNIDDLFTSKANLHLMSNQDLFVKQMYQIETITIGEYGTVKSTTKTESLSTKSIDDSVKKVVLNRPFIFLIMNNETNEVLFIGRFNKPN